MDGIQYHELTQAEYDRKLRVTIAESESLHEHVQDIGDGKATIGWGYTLNRDNNVDIWRDSEIELTPEQWQTLERVDAARTAVEKTRIGLNFTRDLTSAEADQLLRASVKEYEGPVNQLNMPLSDERVALVSVTWNRGPGAITNHPIMDAIREGNRAEAWYEMRYNCWGSNQDYIGGLYKRRFAESEAFGLYNDRDNVTVEEARDVYEMYQSHRTDIDRVERRFGVTIDGVEANPNRIDQANRDYPEMVSEYGQVRTIFASLAGARGVLLEHLREQHPERAHEFTEEKFNSGQINLNQQQGLGPDDPSHPDHTMLNQIRGGVREMDKYIGKPYDDDSERLSHSLLATAKEYGMTHVDQVVIGTDRRNMFAVAGDPRNIATFERAHVPIAEAIRTPVEQSDEKLAAVNVAIQRQQEQAGLEELTRGPDGPDRGGRVM